MKQILNIILVAIFTISNISFGQTKVDGSLLKGNVIGGTAANNRRLVLPKDTKANLDALTRIEGNLLWSSDSKKAWVDNGTNLVGVGSGSGGGVNYITDGDAESASASIFVPYANAAGTRPVDGTGGSPTVTTSITSTAPLAGTKSYLLTKPASNVQGQGWSIPFTVDTAYKAKMQKISFDYIVNSGTFVAGSSTTDSDVIWYIYDVTNSTLIEPSNIKMSGSSTTLSDKFQAEFQTSATGSSYRLIAHVASTSALAYELKVDNISIAPSQYVYAAPISDAQLFASTLTNFGNATQNLFYSRDGEYLLLHGSINIGSTAPTGTFTFSLPPGLTINTAKLGAGGASQPFGRATGYRNSTGGSYIADVFIVNLSTNTFQFNSITGAYAPWNATTPITWASGSADRIMIYGVRVPIQGWTSNTQQSDGYDARELSLSMFASTAQLLTTATFTKKIFSTTEISKGLVWDSTNSRVVAVSAGTYSISAFARMGLTTAYTGQILIYKNGVATSLYGSVVSSEVGVSVSGQLSLNANDYIEVFVYQNSGANLNCTGANLHITKVQAPTTISATETIALKYSSTAGTSIAAGGTTGVPYATREYDTHNAWDGTTFRPPAPGFYRFTANTYYASAVINVGAGKNILIRKNNTTDYFLKVWIPSNTYTGNFYDKGDETVYLTTSDTVQIKLVHNEAAARSLDTAAGLNVLTIERIK